MIEISADEALSEKIEELGLTTIEVPERWFHRFGATLGFWGVKAACLVELESGDIALLSVRESLVGGYLFNQITGPELTEQISQLSELSRLLPFVKEKLKNQDSK